MKKSLLAMMLMFVVAPLGAATAWQSQVPVSVDWTSATAQDATLVLAVADYSTVVLTLRTSSLTGGVLTFEVSPNADLSTANWYPFALYRSDSPLTEKVCALSSLSTTSQMWQSPVSGAKWFRVRLSTTIGGGTASLQIQASAAPFAPEGNTAYVDPSDGWALLNYYLKNRIRPITASQQ